MRGFLVTGALITSLALSVQANDGTELSLKTKALASAGTPSTKQADAPFAYGRDPMPQLIMLEEQERRGPRGSCEAAARDLCFDAVERRVVFRPARKYMPKFDGLTPENVSLRGNRIVFKYSFK